jgi:hypothetical protein
MSKEVSPEALAALFLRSEELQTHIDKLRAAIVVPTKHRNVLTRLMAEVSLEHWQGQRLLLRQGMHLTGFALVRMQFETVVRAIWIQACADDAWLTSFVSPQQIDQLAEPAASPQVDVMLSAMERTGPAHMATMLRQLKTAAWKPMHSYVHGGIRPINQALAGVTNYQVSAVLRNANGLALMATNAMTVAAEDPVFRGALGRLQQKFLDSLPPLNPGPPTPTTA